MYLIEIDTLQLKEYIELQIPPYAILSHRWGPEELTFKNVLKNRADKSSRGYRKLLEACKAARSYNVGYIWVDTCCIDKKSSAELSEAINSMYSWYKNAEICLAYLEDVDYAEHDLDRSFMNSKWFTRAWTLQELLAPNKVDFFDSRWNKIGSRASRAKLIQAVTRIPVSALDRQELQLQLQAWDIAEKMSWAAGRDATRTEDIAYSLMGLFDVNMPLLYGEGNKAFIRLQEEIARSSTDLSVFSWGFDHARYHLLARHPAEFLNTRENLASSYLVHVFDSPLHLTNIGLNVELKLIRWQLNQYAVIVRTYLPRNQNFFRYLLLRRSSDWSRVYVLGTKDEEIRFTSSVMYRKRVLTIQRDLPSAEKDLFDTARLPGIARFAITSNGGEPTVWVYTYFDFDSRPCVCMCLHSTQPKLLPTSLQDIKHDEVHSTKRNSKQFQDKDLGLMCYFFSASIDSSYHCQIPGTSIWVQLRPPHELGYWSVEFTLDEPAAMEISNHHSSYHHVIK